jgi:isopentenyl-diphosphate delta-isomerase
MRIALGVGSQRQMLEDDSHLDSFRVVREAAPDTVIIGNIGAEQVAQIDDLSVYQLMVDLIEADGMAVHLNPLQEALQREGNGRFRDVLKGIELMVSGLNVPIIVKEVGCGISEHVARILKDVGVRYIDVAGAGGTSWAAIESFRGADKQLAHRFRDWGIPTAKSLEKVSRIPDLHIIASGGIENGVVMAKAIGLGAEICGAALPFLKVLMEDKTEGLLAMLKLWREELRLAMFLTGSRVTEDLRREGVIEKWNSAKES